MSAKLPLAFCLCVCFVSQSCLTLCGPMDCSPPGSSVHGIFQARLLEWDAISYSRGSSWPRDQADSLPLSLLWSPVSLGTALNLEISLRIDNCVFQSMNMINVFIFYLDSILFLISLYMVFPLVVYRCESWTIKKAECWRTEIGRDLATEQEKAMAPHSSTLAWKIPCTEEPGGLQSMGSLRVGHDWATSLSLFLSCIEEGNDNPLQCSCLENPRDGEPSELPSMGLHRVGHDWSDAAAAAETEQQQSFYSFQHIGFHILLDLYLFLSYCKFLKLSFSF